MKLLLAIFLISIFYLKPVIDNNEWEPYIFTPDSIMIYRQKNGITGLYKYRIVCFIKSSPENVFKATIDDKSYKQLNKYVVKEQVILTENKNLWYKYTVLSPPFISKRDYTLKYLIAKDTEKRNYKISWETANSKGPKPVKGVVRVNDLVGIIDISLSKKEGFSQLIYDAYINPEGYVPSIFVNIINRNSLPEFIRDIRKNSLK